MRELLSHCSAILHPGVECFVFFFFSCNCIVSFGEVPGEVPSVPSVKVFSDLLPSVTHEHLLGVLQRNV